MHPHEAATNAAQEKLRKAETALADYGRGEKPDRDRQNELAQAVNAARRDLLDLLSGLWPEKQ
jgi:hypothetical protein